MESDDIMNEIKEKFLACEYIDNVKIKVVGGGEISVINALIKELKIPISSRLAGWIEKNLIGCWGNQKCKCKGQSNKIFEILNLVMEKLKEN